MNVVELAYLGMSGLLVLSGAVILYPAVAGVQVVVYRRAVLALGTSILLFVASWLVVFLYVFGHVDLDTITVVSLAGDTVAGVLHFTAVWLFARDFVRVGGDTVDVEVEADAPGGFEDARE